MLFLGLVVFFLFTANASQLIIEGDMSNPYGNKSFPAKIDGAPRICFYMENCNIDSHKEISINNGELLPMIFAETNLFNRIILLDISKDNELVYVQIPGVTNFNPVHCTIFQSIQGIDCIKKIKELNTKDEFEVNNQKITDPFRLAENCDAYTKAHSSYIFKKIQPYAIGLGLLVTIIRYCSPTLQLPLTAPIVAFFMPHIFTCKYTQYAIRHFFVKEQKIKKILFIGLFFLLPVMVLYSLNRFI